MLRHLSIRNTNPGILCPSTAIEERAAAQDHPDIVNPYLSHAVRQTAASREFGIQKSSASTTTSLITTANHITQWAGSALSTLMEDELLREQRKRAELVRQLEAQAEQQAKEATLQAEKVERLERKREAAREGWKKRRVNAEEKQAQDMERRKHASEAAVKKRAERRAAIEEQKRIRAEEYARLVEERTAQGMSLDGILSGVENEYNMDELEDEELALDDEDFDFQDEEESKVFGDTTMQSANGGDESLLLQPPGAGAHKAENGNRLLSPSATSATSRKRAASATSSAGGSVATSIKRARLSPSSSAAFVKPEAIETLLPLSTSHHNNSNQYEQQLSSSLGNSGISTYQPPHLQSSPAMTHQLSHQQQAHQSYQPSANGSDDGSLAVLGRSASQRANLNLNRLRGSQSENERKVWSTLARSNIPKVIRVQQQGLVSRQIFHKRLSGAVAREAKKYNSKHPKPPKDVQTKARRVMREMLLYLKSGEKTQRETKRKADKEQLEKAKREEEAREASRAARKLNFLITQTELYSHFVGSKLKSEFSWAIRPGVSVY